MNNNQPPLDFNYTTLAGSIINLSIAKGRPQFITVVDVQTHVRVHQEIELAFDLDKMHLFEKDPPNLRVITEK